MNSRSALLIALLAIPVAGCYHAQVTTERTPGNVVIDKPFATGWVYGLVPPDPVAAASECSNGVARVETRLSFVNQLVSFVTFGIYTPMHITVTCAAAGSASAADATPNLVVSAGSTSTVVVEAFEAAADMAVRSDRAVHVRFETTQP